MRTGINDRILQKQMELQKRAILKIKETLHGEKPFAMEKIDNKIIIDAVNSLGYMDVDMLMAEFGEDKINKLIWQVNKMESRGSG